LKLRLIPHRHRARGLLRADGHSFACAIGRSGITQNKREGDGATPAGEFELRRVLYRADRMAAPATALPLDRIGPGDGWCDAPGHPEYNRQVRFPFDASAERLRRADPVYDIIVVLGHNDDPVIDGAGSAIFMHIAKPSFAPTAGCVALRRNDLLYVLRKCGPGSTMIIA